MKRALEWAGLGIVAVLVLGQFVRPAHTNPPVDPRAALGEGIQVEPHARDVLNRSCMDCHSHRTVWPWYSNVAPVSWLLVSDVNEGREELNFSAWGQYPPRKQAKLLRETCEEVREGKMPPWYYVAMHRGSAVSAAEANVLCGWVERARQQLPAAAVSGEAEAEKDDD